MATPGINTKVKMDGEKEYRAALAQINAGLKNLGAEMRATEQDFADNADSVEALTQKNDVLERTILTQREKVEKLKEVVADATETYKEADKRTIDWKTSLIEAETKLKQMQRALDDNNTALEEAKNATDNLSGEMDDFGQQTNSAAEKVTDAADDIGTMGQKAGDAQRETMGLGSTVDQLTNKLGFSLPEGLKKTMDGLSLIHI